MSSLLTKALTLKTDYPYAIWSPGKVELHQNSPLYYSRRLDVAVSAFVRHNRKHFPGTEPFIIHVSTWPDTFTSAEQPTYILRCHGKQVTYIKKKKTA